MYESDSRGDAGGAPDPSSQGVREDAAPNSDDTVTLEQQSNLGPGAGENPVVTTTAPVQHEDDPVTHHPTLRGDELKEREEEPGTSNP